jgi:CRP-like cAMP-binding protein
MGWVSEGESFGEAALLNPSKPRSSSVVAGDGGVLLAVLDRAAYNRLQMQARSHQVR